MSTIGIGRTVAIAAVLGAASANAFAWNGTEHNDIGKAGYAIACGELQDRVTAKSDPAAQARYDLVCASVRNDKATATSLPHYAYGLLAGEWSALAADHVQSPQELTSVELGDIAIDYRIMTKAAVTNYRHFHPASVTSWRSEHFQSLEAALAASRKEAIPLIEAFEAAMARQAFAQHYLQDSFASGHMGFNRVGSSNAAALAYHNAASARGRCVANAKGEAWITYGDGFLDRSPAAWKSVVFASSLSWFDFLATFVAGKADTSRWQTVWSSFPTYYEDDENESARPCAYSETMKPLRSVSRTAESVTTFDALTVADGTMWGGNPIVVGVLFGGSAEWVYTIPLGYRQIQNRVFGGIGVTTQQPGPRAILADVTYLWSMGTSLRGTLTHEIGVGERYYFASRGRYRTGSLRALYAVKIEAGRAYIRIEAGPAYGYGIWRPHVSAGVGWVYRSKR